MMRTPECGIWIVLVAMGLWAAMARDAKALEIKLPLSDLTRSDLPFVITVPFPDGADKLDVSVVLNRAEDGLKNAAAISAQLAAKRPAEGEPVCRLKLDSSALAEGEYAGEVTVKAGEVEQKQAFSMFRMPEGKPSRGIPYGTYAVRYGNTDEEAQAVVDMLHAHGVDLIQTHINDIWKVHKPYDRAARLGIEFMPSVTTIGMGIKQSDEFHIFFSDGDKPKWPWACMNNATAREKAAEAFAEAVSGFKLHAGFSGLIYYGDDLTIPVKRADGKAFIGCYCDYCRNDFKQRTGFEPPKEVDEKSGVIPADDPYLRWMLYRCENVYGDFVKAMRTAKDSVDPSLRIGMIHGWSGQPFINLAGASYSPITHRYADAVSSYTYPNHRYPRMNFIPHYEMARMNNREKDVWMLGILGMNNTLMHDFVIYQNYWHMLAAGYKLIAYFGWYEYDDARVEKKGRVQHLQETISAHVRVGQHKNWLFPAAAHWKQEPARHAVLFSFTTEAADLLPKDRGFEHLTDVMAFYCEALRQRVPMNFVSEDEIRNGILANYDALCLYAVKALPDDVLTLITEYAAGGKKVYVSKCKVSVPGGVGCSLETAAAMCRDEVQPAVDIVDRDVIVRDFVSGDLRYYVLINNYADRYYGLAFDYGKPEVNYEQGRMIQAHNRALAGSAAFRDKGRWLFDMSTGEPLGRSDQPYSYNLEPSWGQVVVSLPTDRARMKVTGTKTLKQGDAASWKIEMVDKSGKIVSGAYTVKAQITTPSGRRSRYSCCFGLNDGVGMLPLPIGVNDETGKWTVAIEGGFPRDRVVEKLRVTEGEGEGARQMISVQ